MTAGILSCSAGSARAQSAAWWARLSAQAVLAGILVDPVPGGGSATEVKVAEPLVMLRGGLGLHLAFHAALDFEGLTMPGGLLGLGAWGEGFNDRRHPHTYVHEVVVTGRAGAFSLTAGKGFVPFGSDDPMNRPALKFPVNHHWSQILERALVMAGASIGPVTAEAALFNGDEPERPGQWPRIGGRFGDSWSVRVTLAPTRGLELSGSHARVHSPENRPGAGTDQVKWHLSGRLDRPAVGGRVYALAEWARTTEAEGFFKFTSALGEVQWSRGPHRMYYQFERTDRPEEERTVDPFRSLRPHLENSILGVTRWSVHTAGYGFRVMTLQRKLGIEPLIEGSYARVVETAGGLFDPESFYGTRSLWSVTAGIRLSTGVSHRMGRYVEPMPMAGMPEGPDA